MRARNHRDRQMADYYLQQAEALLTNPSAHKLAEKPKSSIKEDWIGFLTDGVSIFQILATISFAAITYWFIGTSVVQEINVRLLN
jgi:hypothetical protein